MARTGSPSHEAPTIERASAQLRHGELRLDLRLQIPIGTRTQPPVATLAAHLRASESSDAGVPVAASHRGGIPRAFPDLPGAVRLGVGFGDGTDYPTRLALAQGPPAEVYNRVNTLLPAETGKTRLRLAIVPPDSGGAKPAKVRLALLRDGKVLSVREITSLD